VGVQRLADELRNGLGKVPFRNATDVVQDNVENEHSHVLMDVEYGRAAEITLVL
jgi:hypothetical protein